MKLQGSEETVSVKIDNLLQLVSCEITNVQSHPELNGRSAKVIGSHDTKLQVRYNPLERTSTPRTVRV